ncbi:barstar family protein [Methylobrevis albus]|uniref:Barstar family protein n=1 Tax=Methylobrevis albus TaxID=2793297 RepID=A0A931MY43_9HYPH|nr:barstar family protein [Methylobrevis albus]MBH0237997.1 barstar family protein [Methylobrevis albus]
MSAATIFHTRMSHQALDNYFCGKTLREGIAVRFVRGGHCETYDDLVKELMASLQFPYYFGRNWGAIQECMIDLEWIAEREIHIVVLDVDAILSRDQADRPALIRCFAGTADPTFDKRIVVTLQTDADDSPFLQLIRDGFAGEIELEVMEASGFFRKTSVDLKQMLLAGDPPPEVRRLVDRLEAEERTATWTADADTFDLSRLFPESDVPLWLHGAADVVAVLAPHLPEAEAVFVVFHLGGRLAYRDGPWNARDIPIDAAFAPTLQLVHAGGGIRISDSSFVYKLDLGDLRTERGTRLICVESLRGEPDFGRLYVGVFRDNLIRSVISLV